MMRHASSHGLAVLICTLASGFIVAMLRTYLPEVLSFFRKLSNLSCDFINLPYPPKHVLLIIIASVMGLIWGIAFSFMHKDK